MIANNSSRFPYEACLMPNLPEEIQHQIRDITNHVVIPLDMLLAVTSFVCNSLVFATVTRTKSLQHPSLLLLGSLTITDLIYSLYSLFRDIKTLAHKHMCLDGSPERMGLSALCNLATLGNLAVISIDRYLALNKPWWYRNHVTKSRAVKMISVPWLISLFIACVVYLPHKLGGGYEALGQITCILFYVICLFVIIFCYLRIYCKQSPPQKLLHMRNRLKREKRLANTVGLIFLVLLLTFLPAVLCPIVLSVSGVKYFQPYSPFFSLFFQLNGVLNPLLNFGRSKDMRKVLRDLFKCPQQVQPLSVTSSAPQDPTAKAKFTTTTTSTNMSAAE